MWLVVLPRVERLFCDFKLAVYKHSQLIENTIIYTQGHFRGFFCRYSIFTDSVIGFLFKTSLFTNFDL